MTAAIPADPPEPTDPLWVAVKAIDNSWPPDKASTAAGLAQAWGKSAQSATTSAGQVGAAGQSVGQAWVDPAGTAVQGQVSSQAKTFMQLAEQMNGMGAQAEKYAQTVLQMKNTIVQTIAEQSGLYASYANPAFGEQGAQFRADLAKDVAAKLKERVGALAAGLGVAPPPPAPPPPVPEKTEEPEKPESVLGKVGDYAGAASAVLGFLSLFPPLTPFTAPLAAGAGIVALTAHGIDMVASDKFSDGRAWMDLGNDAMGLVPGVRGVKAIGDAIVANKAIEGGSGIATALAGTGAFGAVSTLPGMPGQMQDNGRALLGVSNGVTNILMRRKIL